MIDISNFKKNTLRYSLLSVFLLLDKKILFAQSFDETINNAFKPITKGLSDFIFFSVEMFGAEVPLIVLWLVGAAVFFTFYFKFLNLTGFRHAISLVKGDYSDGKDVGEVSHFQALATALSGTVGIGNIEGVAILITIVYQIYRMCTRSDVQKSKTRW